MAIFNESYTNILIESTSIPFRFIDPSAKIDDEDKCLEDKKLISTINKAWPQIKKEINNFVGSLIDEWYMDEDEDGKKSYMYGANTVGKVMKFAILDYIGLTKRSGKYGVDIIYNNKYKRQGAEKFFGGHSLTVNFFVDESDYKIGRIYCNLEG